MDIWRWVMDSFRETATEGDPRLARLIFDIPRHVGDLEHDEVDALVPEALALARAARKPWLELYFRHWHLQSRVIHRHEVKGCLPEAVDLLDFASRPELEGCPQSVCVVQDLACTWADLDGPGYVDERLAVAAETLGRIDASWPCWDCISGEYGAALIDAGRHEELLAFVNAQMDAVVKAGEEIGHNLKVLRAEVLLSLKRPTEALEQTQDITVRDPDHVTTLRRDILLARCYIALDRHDEARQTIPDLERVRRSPGYYDTWMELALEAVAADCLDNTWQLGSTLVQMGDRLDQNGSIYKSCRLWAAAAALALGRGAHASAARAFARLDAQLPRLRRPEVIKPRVDALRDRLTEAPAPSLPDDPDAISDALSHDPERDLPILEAAISRWPHLSHLYHSRASALHALGATNEAIASLEAALDGPAASPALLGQLGDLLLETERGDLLDALTARFTEAPGSLGAEARRLGARRASIASDLDAAAALLGALLDTDQALWVDAVNLASVERRRGDAARGVALLDAWLDRAEPGPLDWEMMVCATLDGQWSKVRRSAARLGMDLDGEGPIDEPWHWCRIVLPGDDPASTAVAAIRNGPVTARIAQITAPNGEDEFFSAVVVFDPRPLGAEEREDGERVTTWGALAVLEQGAHRSFTLDGARPDPDTIERLQGIAERFQGVFRDVTNPDYTLEGDVPGFYALLAVPDTTDLLALSHDLEAALGDAPRIAWPALAAATGDPDTAQRHAERATELGL